MMPINERQSFPSVPCSNGFGCATSQTFKLPPPEPRRKSTEKLFDKRVNRSDQGGVGYFVRLANSSPMIKNNSSPSMASTPQEPRQYWTLPCTAYAVKKTLKNFMPRSLPQTPLNRRFGSSFRTITSSLRVIQPTCSSNIADLPINTTSENCFHRTVKNSAKKSYLAATPLTKNSHSICDGNVEPNCNESCLTTILAQFSLTEALLYQDGILLSGSLKALIQHLVPTEVYFPEKTYVFAFLLTSRLHIPPNELLEKVASICANQQKFYLPKELNASDFEVEVIAKSSFKDFAVYIVKLLNQWTTTFPQDFRNETTMRNLMAFTKALEQHDKRLCSELSQIRANLLARLSIWDCQSSRLSTFASVPPRRTAPALHVTNHLFEISKDPKEVAHQLTHLELDRIKSIGPEEFVTTLAKGSKENVSGTGDCSTLTSRLQSPEGNLDYYIDWFNRISFLTATEICMHRKKKHRAAKINFFVEISKECFNIGNFNSLMAILAGLNLAPVLRLKKTWNKIDREQLNALEHQMDPTSNFLCYRSALKAAKWRSSGNWGFQGKIIVPFFSVLMKDIYYINQGFPDFVPENGHLNFNKFWQIAKRVSEFMSWQQTECLFAKNEAILNYLSTSAIYDEDSLSLASYECESPDFSPDKDHHKTLKSERP